MRQSQIMYETVRPSLEAQGYDAMRPIRLNREMRYRLLVVAVNHLAHCLGREPYRVYQALLCRAERTRLGRPYTAYKQARPEPEGSQRGRRALRVICPRCGTDLLEEGPVTQKEVRMMREAGFRDEDVPEARRRRRPARNEAGSPQESPHSDECEAKNTHNE